MEPLRAILFGNAGSGKSSLARQLAAERTLPILSLDGSSAGIGSNIVD